MLAIGGPEPVSWRDIVGRFEAEWAGRYRPTGSTPESRSPDSRPRCTRRCGPSRLTTPRWTRVSSRQRSVSSNGPCPTSSKVRRRSVVTGHCGPVSAPPLRQAGRRARTAGPGPRELTADYTRPRAAFQSTVSAGRMLATVTAMLRVPVSEGRMLVGGPGCWGGDVRVSGSPLALPGAGLSTWYALVQTRLGEPEAWSRSGRWAPSRGPTMWSAAWVPAPSR